jgi:hypothetical protein
VRRATDIAPAALLLSGLLGLLVGLAAGPAAGVVTAVVVLAASTPFPLRPVPLPARVRPRGPARRDA